MTDAKTGELPTKTIILKWEPTGESDERASAGEMISALFDLIDGWLEPLAIETYAGCYDRAIFTEGSVHLPQPYHLLIREPLPDVCITPLHYRASEERRDLLVQETVSSWINELLAQSCGDPERYETSLRGLWVQASNVRAPRKSLLKDLMVLDYATGRTEVPIERRGDTGWISGPRADLVPQPVAIDIANLDGWLRLAIEVFWSPWLAELNDAGGMLQQGIGRLFARGWKTSEG